MRRESERRSQIFKLCSRGKSNSNTAKRANFSLPHSIEFAQKGKEAKNDKGKSWANLFACEWEIVRAQGEPAADEKRETKTLKPKKAFQILLLSQFRSQRQQFQSKEI